MAKKRNVRKVRHVKHRHVAHRHHPEYARHFAHFSKVANVLTWIAIVVLLINSIALIFLRDSVITELKNAGISLTPSAVALMGVLWLMIAFFAWSINRTIKEKLSKVPMWELFILSIICILSGRIDSGALLLVASVIYLVTRKKK